MTNYIREKILNHINKVNEYDKSISVEEIIITEIKYSSDWIYCERLINKYIELIAIRQKQLCADQFYGSSGMIIDRILNAPTAGEEYPLLGEINKKDLDWARDIIKKRESND